VLGQLSALLVMMALQGLLTERQMGSWDFAALFVYMLLQPVVGALSDRTGRRPVMFAFSVGGMLLTVPVMTVLGHTRNPWRAFLLMTAAPAVVTGCIALTFLATLLVREPSRGSTLEAEPTAPGGQVLPKTASLS
jgi:MFS family permease